jgi:hypothetical protein
MGSSAGACSILVLAGLPLKSGMLPRGAVAEVHVMYLYWLGGCCYRRASSGVACSALVLAMFQQGLGVLKNGFITCFLKELPAH